MHSFPKTNRIVKKKDFQRLRKDPLVYKSKGFIVFHRENSFEGARLGISVLKKAGNAVVRNKIKRLIRESFRCRNALKARQRDIHILVSRPQRSLSDFSKYLNKGLNEMARLT